MELTEAQQMAVDAIGHLGPMTPDELATACLRFGKARGGFSGTIVSLWKRKLFRSDDDVHIQLTAEGERHVRPLP